MPASVGSRLKPFSRRPLDRRPHALRRLAILLVLACASADAERLPVGNYSTVDGLAHNHVDRIVSDSHGFLWFCTPDGLSRFDGYAFRSFGTEVGLPPAAVNDLLETAEGDYWVATDNGLVQFDRRSSPASAPLRRADAAAAASALRLITPAGGERRSSTITVLRQARDGTIWVGTGNGLYRLDQPRDVPALTPVDIGLPHGFPEQRIIADLLEDRHGTLWVATLHGLYRRGADGSIARYGIADGLPAESISDLFEDQEGRLWVATRTAGFFSLVSDASHDRLVVGVSMSSRNGLPYDWVTQLFQASDGRFWIGTERGLVEFLPPGAAEDGPALRVYSTRHGLPNDYIAALGEDRGGNVWIGTDSAGAFKLTSGGFATYGPRDGINSVNAIFEDQAGNVCFRGSVLGGDKRSAFDGAKLGTLREFEPEIFQRFGCFDGKSFQWFIPHALAYPGWVREGVTLQARNGEWWIGSEQGLLRYPSTRRFVDVKTTPRFAAYTTQDGLASNQIFRLFEDSRGDVWISTISSATRGLSLFERKTGMLHDLSRMPGLPSPVDDLARSFAEDPSGSVWLAFNSGVARYANGAMSFFTPGKGLPAGAIREMHVDTTGRLWLASERGGLVRVDDPSASAPTFVNYTVTNGLSSNNLFAITEDLHGYLYIGGGTGIDRFDPATGRVRRFTQADGLPPGIVRGAYRDRHGVLWFGTSNGLARLAPAPEKRRVPPSILISGLRVASVPYRISPFGEQQLSLANLPPDDHQLEIEFAGLGFGPGEVLRYEYKLEGAGTEWSPQSARRAVTYASLSPGRYTFAVRAVNSDGVASTSPATISFTVLPPFWQRWWFIGIVALAIGLAGTLGYRYRIKRLLEVANMRTHIATDLHDDIGANLTRIALLSEVAQRTREEAPLVSIATVARESVAAMSDIVWAINPRREGLLDLTRRMRQHASELFTLRGIALRFDAPAGAETQPLGIDVRRDVLLIFKEAINNAARHSGCAAVDIMVRIERGRLVLSIVDDGVGFDASTDFDGQGLTSMRRRAARINATLRIEPSTPSGTSVVLSVPI
jgi:ligand-binding sensor domain-containing protein/two-component sensor histidine kinase